MHYNRQPYSGSDTGGRRTKEWFDKIVWPHIQEYIPNPVGLALDAGCGNGRFFPRLSETCDKLVALDPVEEIHSDYDGMAEFYKQHFHEFTYPEKFDVIFFMASFMIIAKQEKIDVQDKCRELLKDNGCIMIYIDWRDIDLVYKTFDFYQSFKTDDSKTGFVIAR